jgi:hypothetical protein
MMVVCIASLLVQPWRSIWGSIDQIVELRPIPHQSCSQARDSDSAGLQNLQLRSATQSGLVAAPSGLDHLGDDSTSKQGSFLLPLAPILRRVRPCACDAGPATLCTPLLSMYYVLARALVWVSSFSRDGSPPAIYAYFWLGLVIGVMKIKQNTYGTEHPISHSQHDSGVPNQDCYRTRIQSCSN